MCTSKYKISIPEPCHEDWNKMSPEQQGRFCGVCSKTVVDFSNKSQVEVDAIIDEKKGEKVCGRFRIEQVETPLTLSIPTFFPAHGLSFRKLFAVALFLVFGTGLFSCQSQQGELVGKIAITGDMLVEPLTVKGDVNRVDTLEMQKIDSIQKIEIEPERMQGEIEVRPEIYALGGPRFVENPGYVKEPIKGSLAPVDTLDPVDFAVVGMMAIQIEPPIIEPIKEDTVMDLQIQNMPPEDSLEPVLIPGMDLAIFPNPTNGRISITYSLKNRSDASLAIFDLAGKRRKELFAIKGLYGGNYTLSTDLSDLPSGTYFIIFTAGNEQKTLKVILQK